ncbi:hypothetical protein TNCV_5015641 [Trichonephila clavipes]|nr:hypothetical protein TNCV_5015641 [Trichonephila clavipes]
MTEKYEAFEIHLVLSCLGVKVTESGLACHMFKPSTVEDPPCKGTMHVKSVESQTSCRWCDVEVKKGDASSDDYFGHSIKMCEMEIHIDKSRILGDSLLAANVYALDECVQYEVKSSGHHVFVLVLLPNEQWKDECYVVCR